MSFFMSKVKSIFTCVMIVSLTGCSSFYRVNSQYVSNDSEVEKPEILETKQYQSGIKSVNVIAVQAPDKCTQDTASTKRGQSNTKESVVVSVCGDSLSDIERGLVRAGFQVVSWKQFQAEQQQNSLTPREAAKKLNTDAIFLINSLDTSEVKMGRDARFERRFYHSNEEGEKESKALVGDTLKEILLSSIKPEEKSLYQSTRLSATVNATVMLAETGQSIWFYEWTVPERKEIKTEFSVLVQCASDDDCETVAPLSDEGFFDDFSENLSSGDVEAISTAQLSANQKVVIWDKLLKEVIADLLTRFSGSEG